ncbi:290_t:CDS:2, partial [Funneliformis geosporum]
SIETSPSCLRPDCKKKVESGVINSFRKQKDDNNSMNILPLLFNDSPLYFSDHSQKKRINESTDKASNKKAKKLVNRNDSPKLKKLIEELSSETSQDPEIIEVRTGDFSDLYNAIVKIEAKESLSIVRISTALFVRVEQGEWSGVLDKEVENFENILKRVLEQVPLKDIERKKKLRSFGTGKKLAKQVRGICSDIEELLTSNVNRYYKSKNRQKIKIEANTTSNSSNTFSRLDGLEKQLEKREALLRQKENNIKKTIEAQVDEEYKCLKDEYDTLKDHLEGEYNKCMIDMKQTSYSFKHKLEDQQKSSSENLEKQYKSHISTLEKSIAVKDKKIGKLSATISQLKNYKNALKKDFAFAKKTIKVLDGIIYRKNKTIIAYNKGLWKIDPS